MNGSRRGKGHRRLAPARPPGLGSGVWCLVSGVRVRAARVEAAPWALLVPCLVSAVALSVAPALEKAVLWGFTDPPFAQNLSP